MRLHKLCEGVRWALLAGLVAASPLLAADDAATNEYRDGATTRIITRAELEKAGYVSIGDVLQRLPQSGGALNPLFNGGGNGDHRVDLRDFGDARTLVLVNGRRFVTTHDGGTDLTGIPFGAVERIEITLVGDGARAGSGAIAGTINIVLRESFEGAEARAWVG